MKKLALSFLLLCCCHLYAYSQANNIDKVHLRYPKPIISEISAAVGPMFSYPIAGKFSKKYTAADLGMTATVALSHRFKEWFSVVGALYYEQKGYKAIYHDINEAVIPNREEKTVLTSKLQYGTLALIPKFTPINRFPIYVGVGPYGSVLLRNEGIVERYVSGKRIYRQAFAQRKGSYIDYDYGITACLGYPWKINNKMTIVIEGRYIRGLTTINKPTIGELTNNAFAIAIGMSLMK
ncbi:MAG: hypothetical protein ABIS36_07380 [Chryseolinea sp.]